MTEQNITYILFDMSPDLFGELQPTLLMDSSHTDIFGIDGILELKTRLHAGHWAVAAMFQNVREGFQ